MSRRIVNDSNLPWKSWFAWYEVEIRLWRDKYSFPKIFVKGIWVERRPVVFMDAVFYDYREIAQQKSAPWWWRVFH